MIEGTLITNKEARGWRVLAGRRVSSFQFVFSQGVSFSLPPLTLTSPYPPGVRLRIKPLLSFGGRCGDGGFDHPPTPRRKAPPPYSAPGLYRSVTSFVKTTDHGAEFWVFL